MSSAPFYSDRDALGRPLRRRRAAARRPGPRPGHRRRPALPGPRRDARDRGEPAPRVPHPARGAGRVRRPLAPAGRRGAGRGPVRRRDRPGHRAAGAAKGDTVVDRDEHIRPDTTLEALAAAAADPGPRRPRRDRHRRATPPARTTAPPPASSPRPSRPPSSACARWSGWSPGPWPGSPPATMGIGPVPATAKALDARRAHPGRHRPDRAQRGLRRPGAGGDPGVGLAPATSTGSTSTARASRSATRSAPPAGASWPPCPGRWTAARPATAWRPCASAVARAWPPSSSASDEPDAGSARSPPGACTESGASHPGSHGGPRARVVHGAIRGANYSESNARGATDARDGATRTALQQPCRDSASHPKPCVVGSNPTGALLLPGHFRTISP